MRSSTVELISAVTATLWQVVGKSSMIDGRFRECCSDGDQSPISLDQGQHYEPVLKLGNLRGRVGESLT